MGVTVTGQGRHVNDAFRTVRPMRRVVTGHDGDGSAVFLSDGEPGASVTAPNGFGVSELLWLDGPPADPMAGADRDDGGWKLEPPAGGLSSRVVTFPGNGDWVRVPGDSDDAPGMHATDTLDVMVVVSGEIVLGLADGSEHTVTAGDFVVQRGTQHRWKVVADQPCTYFVTMLRPGGAGRSALTMTNGKGSGVRRFVTGGTGVEIGDVPVGVEVGQTRLLDVWQTGGPLGDPTQGGDAPPPWSLEPVGGGVAVRLVELGPGTPIEGAAWHTTATIDVDLVLSGRVALDLPGDRSVELGPGDAVVQRGTEHRWRVLGDQPFRMAAVMIAIPAP